jgi:Tfp pilus assembly protein PilX
MTVFRRLLSGERGMILLTSLLLLSLLLAIGLGSMVSVQNEFSITQNLRGGISALYLADAGIEWGKEQIGTAPGNPPDLLDSTQNFSAGTFSVAFVSATKVSPLSARIVLRSTGTARSSSQTVQAQVSKIYDLADAALGLRGNSRSINFAVGSFQISGLDYDPSKGAPIPGAKPRAGITIDSAALFGQLENGLNGAQRGQISGGGRSGATISLSERIPGESLARFASDLCTAPNAQVSAVPAAGTLSLVDQVWGNLGAPQLHCINGLMEGGDSVITGGNFIGAGILVVKDATLIVSGTFHWEGLIIVTGNDIGFRTVGQENKEVIGALIVNEMGFALGAGPAILDIQSAIRILYSRSALGASASLIRSSALANSYAWLPFDVRQDYWRSLSP